MGLGGLDLVAGKVLVRTSGAIKVVHTEVGEGNKGQLEALSQIWPQVLLGPVSPHIMEGKTKSFVNCRIALSLLFRVSIPLLRHAGRG